MPVGGGRFFGALIGAFAAGCGGSSTDQIGVSDRSGDASTDAGSVRESGSRDHDAGGRPNSNDAGRTERDAAPTIPVDASIRDVEDGAADGSDGLCAPPSSTAPGADAGKCLGIFYATVARVVLWVRDASAPGGGTRLTMATGESKAVGSHTYGYSGNSLITSGSAVDIHLDVDGQKDSLELFLSGCAPATGFRTWDYPATLTRTTCLSCAPTSIARHYSVVQDAADGELDYTFTADDPPRTCGAGVDMLEFTTWPG
jgi:hypothetical protein